MTEAGRGPSRRPGVGGPARPPVGARWALPGAQAERSGGPRGRRAPRSLRARRRRGNRAAGTRARPRGVAPPGAHARLRPLPKTASGGSEALNNANFPPAKGLLLPQSANGQRPHRAATLRGGRAGLRAKVHEGRPRASLSRPERSALCGPGLGRNGRTHAVSDPCPQGSGSPSTTWVQVCRGYFRSRADSGRPEPIIQPVGELPQECAFQTHAPCPAPLPRTIRLPILLPTPTP